MRTPFFITLTLFNLNCTHTSSANADLQASGSQSAKPSFDKGTWQHFLQHLPITSGPVLDYKGNIVDINDKHVAIVKYDVGTKDLQQCADALMRLRAEFLFAEKRFNEIGFHFTSGHFFSFKQFCQGYKPVVSGSRVDFKLVAPQQNNHASLRNYLDIIYSYAGTISLTKELKEARDFYRYCYYFAG